MNNILQNLYIDMMSIQYIYIYIIIYIHIYMYSEKNGYPFNFFIIICDLL